MTYPAYKNERSLSNKHILPLASTIWSPISKGSGSTPGTERSFKSRVNTTEIFCGKPQCVCTVAFAEQSHTMLACEVMVVLYLQMTPSVVHKALWFLCLDDRRHRNRNLQSEIQTSHSVLLYLSLLMNCHVLELVTNSQLLLIQVQECLLLAFLSITLIIENHCINQESYLFCSKREQCFPTIEEVWVGNTLPKLN